MLDFSHRHPGHQSTTPHKPTSKLSMIEGHQAPREQPLPLRGRVNVCKREPCGRNTQGEEMPPHAQAMAPWAKDSGTTSGQHGGWGGSVRRAAAQHRAPDLDPAPACPAGLVKAKRAGPITPAPAEPHEEDQGPNAIKSTWPSAKTCFQEPLPSSRAPGDARGALNKGKGTVHLGYQFRLCRQ